MEASACDSTAFHDKTHHYGRIPSHRAPQKLSIGSFCMKLRALPYGGIGTRFYGILRQETPLRPNTEPQGVPEALDRFFLLPMQASACDSTPLCDSSAICGDSPILSPFSDFVAILRFCRDSPILSPFSDFVATLRFCREAPILSPFSDFVAILRFCRHSLILSRFSDFVAIL